MTDFVPKGTGNSRFLKSSIPANTTHDELVALLRNGTFPVDLNGTNAEGVQTQGTALSKKNLLQDSTAALIGLGSMSDPTVDDAFLAVSGNYVLRLQVTVNGSPAKAGIVIASGMTPLSGDTVETDENGMAVGMLSPSGATVKSRDYIDMPAVSLAIPAPSSVVTEATLALTSAAGEREYTSSQSTLYFSPYATDFDVCCVGGGGGGCHGNGYAGVGGGGGYVTNQYKLTVEHEKSVSVTIGSGGTAKLNDGNPGGTTTVKHGNSTVSASGGGGGHQFYGDSHGGYGNGNGGKENAYNTQSNNGEPGTVYKFDDPSSILFSGGGGAGANGYDYGVGVSPTYGGASYGGSGGYYNVSYTSEGLVITSFTLPYNGTGPGGGGGGYCSGYNTDTNALRPDAGAGYRGTCWLRWRVG